MIAGLHQRLESLLSDRPGGEPADEQDRTGIDADQFRYRPEKFTDRAPHLRDSFRVSRWMFLFTAALIAPLLIGLYNTGYQVAEASRALGAGATQLGRGTVLTSLGIDAAASSITASFVIGLVYYLPVYLVALLAAGGWEHLFAVTRGRKRVEGIAVTTLLFTLSLPPTVALWQVAVGMSFGVVIGKEVFGGTGRTFLNPALVGLVFLYFAYPEILRSNSAPVPVQGWTDGTLLDRITVGGVEVLEVSGVTWLDAFLGLRPGGFGDRSTAACLVGAGLLLYARAISWRILAGGVLGLAATAVVFAQLSSGLVPTAELAWYWHATLGGFAFGLVFFATDPATAPFTNTGRWLYGILIGVMTVVIRAANPAHSDGALLAILLGNVSSPLIDHFVIRANIRRRKRRYG